MCLYVSSKTVLLYVEGSISNLPYLVFALTHLLWRDDEKLHADGWPELRPAVLILDVGI